MHRKGLENSAADFNHWIPGKAMLEMRNSPVVNKDIPTDSQVIIEESVKLSNDASMTKYN